MHADGRPDHCGPDYLRLTANEAVGHLRDDASAHASAEHRAVAARRRDRVERVTVGDLTLLVANGTFFDLDIEDFRDGDRTDPCGLRPVPLAAARPRTPPQANVDARSTRSRRPGRRRVPTSTLENSPP